MSSIFEKQIQSNTEKIEGLINNLESKNLVAITGGIQIDNLEEKFKNNTLEFKDLAFKVARSLVPGQVSGVTYAAVCARFCKEFNVPYKVYAGFCLKASHRNKEKDIAYFNKKKEAGAEHPMMVTHAYLVAGDKTYEYYSGETENIEHLDCVVIAEG